MRLAFIDFVYFYDAARPEVDEPLGGTTSAICFLAREMVKTGIACTFFNRVPAPQEAHGIKSLPLQALSEELGKTPYDAYIFCGRWTAELVGLVRVHTKAPLIAWMHESLFAPPMTPALESFDGVVYVSEWQKKTNQPAARPKWRQTVIRNAMNPALRGIRESVWTAKEKPPVLLFAGSFARGAFHVPPLLDKIRAKRTDFSVEMYCNLNPSRDAEKDAAYIEWLRGQSNIAHVGMVGQLKLIERMQRASVMLMPNPWPETSCISLIEGMAAGLDVVLSDRAALPETASYYGRQIPIDLRDDPLRFDMAIDYDAFAEAVLEAMAARERDPLKLEAKLREQVGYFQKNYQWEQRVAPWVTFIKNLSVKK